MLKVPERVEIDGLIERWQKHRDQRAFERLLEMHLHVIGREVHRYRWPDVEYEDRVAVAREAFLCAANKATPGNDSAKFATYCGKFIREALIDAKRRSDAADPTKGRDGEPDGEWVYLDEPPEPTDDEDGNGTYELVDPNPSPERVAIARLDVKALMASLTDKERRAIEALHVEGLTQAEAAERLGNDVRTVRRIAKAVGDRNA